MNMNEWFICFSYEHIINFIVEQVASIKYTIQMDIVNVIDILPLLALSKNKSRFEGTYESHMLLSVDVVLMIAAMLYFTSINYQFSM